MMDSYKPLYILDSSIIIKWLCEEVDSDKALKIKAKFIQDEIELGIPTLAYYETINFIARAYPAQAVLIFSQFLMLKITEFFVTLENIAETIDITQQFPKTAFYDATYHALAIQNNGIFITADEKYYNQAKSMKHIQLLKDYK